MTRCPSCRSDRVELRRELDQRYPRELAVCGRLGRLAIVCLACGHTSLGDSITLTDEECPPLRLLKHSRGKPFGQARTDYERRG